MQFAISFSQCRIGTNCIPLFQRIAMYYRGKHFLAFRAYLNNGRISVSVCRSNVHYHIRWSSSDSLDWQAFKTHEQAEAAAHGLVRRRETYTVETRFENCERCEELAQEARNRKKTT